MTSSESRSLSGDDRTVSWGLGRLVMALFWVFGIASLLLALWGLMRSPEVPLGSRIAAVLAGAIYVVIAVGITHNGRRMRMVAWVGLITAMVGPIIAGVMGIGRPPVRENLYSAWASFGADYWFFPLVLPVIGLVWMWYSDPRRIVELSEGIERRAHSERL